MANRTKHQTGETRVVERGSIHGAEYNPRVIDDETRKRLKKSLRQHGLVGAQIVINDRTGNIVSGHQRLDVLDQLEKSQDYSLAVTVIDVDEREEKKLNVLFNNASIQGEWDVGKLADLVAQDGLSVEDLGFSDADAQILFGGDSRLADLFTDPPDKEDAKKQLHDMHAIQRVKADNSNTHEKQSTDYILTVVCQSQDEKKRLCKALGIPDYETFTDARSVFTRLGAA